jgi:hypothetical protein
MPPDRDLKKYTQGVLALEREYAGKLRLTMGT